MMSGLETKELGLTKQRGTVLEVIQHSDTHLTANEVFLAAKERLPSISFATVYNSLRFLKDAGHIAEITFGNGASRYDRMTHRHDHAICTDCGMLVDIEMDLPADLISMAESECGFKTDSIEFTLRGRCPDCAGKH